ncbi:DUF4181 domain-containing protein [Halobacillus shinanisalinarum]|uniref:DUF4181 domain-containing protein n=1 Tax=Halobacillus shinanisalinarum TaxID=2932258 RepID=A0ABY4GXB2_9BACI|nr:DUF4181 domain-containing protein [Halobacillus shinanisalinarum]UOQ92360.1 DUF4181 domain-containing protein [Halobacillus shinanisalinarum]
MEHYGLPPWFWLKLLTILGAVAILIGGIPALLRRKMGADKKNWFSYNHINEFHKNWDWTLRIFFVMSLIGCVIIFPGQNRVLFLISMVLIISQLGLQSYVEWKITKNRVNYKVSLIEVGLTFMVAIGVMLWLE